MTTLCIVDMQTHFSDSAERCLDAVCHQIKLAKKRKAGIVLIEFGDCGDTYNEIKILLASYNHTAYATKQGMDGSKEFLTAAEKANFSTNKIRFVGVNRGQCVYATVKKVISLIGCQVEIVANATWCGAPTPGLRKLRRLGKII